MAHRITLIPGDGVGPELTDCARRAIEATGVVIDWEIMEAGEEMIAKCGTPLPEPVLASIRKNGVALKGPISTPIGTGFRSVNVTLRKELNLYACVRPCRYYPGVRSHYPGTDLVVVRENTEDLYAGVEFAPQSPEAETIRSMAPGKIAAGAAISIKPISPEASRRIVKYAFDYAVKHGRRKVTAVTKANIMKLTDGLFYEAAREVAKDYAGKVEYEERLVDNMCMQLVQKPEDYDVLVMPNLYGDILSDLCAGLVGGLGMAPGANIGDGVAVFEPTHGSAPKYKGQNKVNPSALILSGVMMLRHIGEEEAADRLENALTEVLAEGKYVTYDLKPVRHDPSAVGTKEMTDAIIAKMKK
ncbi:MAG TPA: isocitrate/isopropylmalate dehydrogenase family protein [Firmicutes bacterium]|nr:isocitrate/isopropylmalate dehydrogenase family protein [Bacillota bacterium]